MNWRDWNKMLVVSFSLAAAGILVCMAALMETVVPKSSPFLGAAALVALGMVGLGVVMGYVWVCDKCEAYVSGRADRLLSKGMRNSSAPATRDDAPPRPGDQNDRRILVLRFSPSEPVKDRNYVGGLHRFVWPRRAYAGAAGMTRRWHGQ
jgi:hypothetical protein